MIAIIKLYGLKLKGMLFMFLAISTLFIFRARLNNTNHIKVIDNKVILDQKALKTLYHSALVSFNADLEVMKKMPIEDFAPYSSSNADLRRVKEKALETTTTWLARLQEIFDENKTNNAVIIDLELFIRASESMLCTLQKKYHIEVRQKFYLGNYEPQINAFADFINKLTNDEYGYSLMPVQQSFFIEGLLNSAGLYLS